MDSGSFKALEERFTKLEALVDTMMTSFDGVVDVWLEEQHPMELSG